MPTCADELVDDAILPLGSLPASSAATAGDEGTVKTPCDTDTVMQAGLHCDDTELEI